MSRVIAEAGCVVIGNTFEPAGTHTLLAWSAVSLAVVAVVLWALALAGQGGAGAGMVISLVAFALALTAKVKHVRWAPLWLPLVLFPVLAATTPLWV